MKKRAQGFCAAIAFLMASSYCYASQKPSDERIPSAQPASSVAVETKVSPRIGTEAAPLVIRGVPADNTAELAADAKHRAWEMANAKKVFWLGIAMALLAALQLIYFAIQLSIMRGSQADSRKAADAARAAAEAATLNARAAIGIELPIIRALPSELLTTSELIDESDTYSGTVNDSPPGRFSAVGFIELRNDGRTPAFLRTIAVGWAVASILPEVPKYRRMESFSHNAIITSGDTFTADFHYGIELSADELESTAKDEKWLWFYGQIEYVDFLDQRRFAGFCWRYADRNPPSGFKFYHFASDGNPPSAYTARS